jgi:hypothetical protein
MQSYMKKIPPQHASMHEKCFPFYDATFNHFFGIYAVIKCHKLYDY